MTKHENELLEYHLLKATTDCSKITISNSSSKKTNSNSTPGTTWAKDGDKIPKEVLHWPIQNIDAELSPLEQTQNEGNEGDRILLKMISEEHLPFPKRPPHFLMESEIQHSIRDSLFPYVISVVSTADDKLSPMVKGAENPDIVIKKDETTILVGEVKTFWSYNFDETEDHLVDIWTTGKTKVRDNYNRHDYYMSRGINELKEMQPEVTKNQYGLESKVFHLIIQHFGQLNGNGLKYGFITTWNYWWITKRQQGGKLFISKAFQHNHDKPTILQLLGRLLKTAKTNFELEMEEIGMTLVSSIKPADRDRSNKKMKTSKDSDHSDTSSDLLLLSSAYYQNNPEKQSIVKRLIQIAQAPRRNLCINDNGCVVRALMKGEPDQVMKITWVPDYPEAKELYEHECRVYEKLKCLQGRIIPEMNYHHPFWLSGVGGTLVIAMSYVGESLTEEKVGSLSRAAREEAVTHLRNIHELGVLHGDLRLPNIVWNRKVEKLMFIDFGLSEFIQDQDLSKNRISMEEDELRTLLQLEI